MSNAKRVVRARAVKPGDQMMLKGCWWVVDRLVEQGEKVTLSYKDTKTEVTAPSQATSFSFVASRGSRHDLFTFQQTAIVTIIRERQKGGA